MYWEAIFILSRKTKSVADKSEGDQDKYKLHQLETNNFSTHRVLKFNISILRFKTSR